MESLTTYYLTQGVLGVTVVALILVVIWQQRRIDSKDKQIIDLQNQRITDTNGYTASYVQTTKEMVAAQKDSLNATSLMQRSLDSLAGSLQNILTILNNKSI